MGWKLGSECVLKIGSGAQAKELKLAREVTVELGGTEIDASHRGSTVKQFVLGLQELSITGSCLYDPEDEAVQALFASYNDRSAFDLTISDPSMTYTGKWTVTRLTNGQPLDDIATLDFTLRPSIMREAP